MEGINHPHIKSKFNNNMYLIQGMDFQMAFCLIEYIV